MKRVTLTEDGKGIVRVDDVSFVDVVNETFGDPTPKRDAWPRLASKKEKEAALLVMSLRRASSPFFLDDE